MSMYILGINVGHHPSLALLKDGELIYYLEDDRWNRKKEREWKVNDVIQSLVDVMRYTRHLDHVIFASYGKDDRYDEPDTPSDVDIIESVKKQILNWNITVDNFHHYLEHHLYHACSAFYGSGFEEAAALVLDGGGMYILDYLEARESETMYYFSDTGESELLSQIYTPSYISRYGPPYKFSEEKWLSSTASCGWLFNTICMTTHVWSPGKVMGLSPYGNLDTTKDDKWFYYHEESDRWYTDNKNVLNTIRRLYGKGDITPHKVESLPKKPIFEVNADLAKKVQEETREHTIRLIQTLLDKVKTNNVVLSGGYFLNCVNNYEYIKAFPHINFYIDPIAHDGGTAHGAAKYLWHHILKMKDVYPLKSLFLGG